MFPKADAPVADGGKTDEALGPVLEVMKANFSEHALNEINPALQGIQGVERKGDRYTVTRGQDQTIPVNGDLLNGTIEVKSLEIGKVSFDYDGKTHRLSNIDGLAINMSILGSTQKLEIDALSLATDDKGNPVLRGALDNPLPAPAMRIIGMPKAFNVEFPIQNGTISTPRLSKMFADAASSTGPSIAGLLTSDLLNEASNVSLFVESNPKWVENVVKPALGTIAKELDLASLANQSFADVEVLSTKFIGAPGDKGRDLQVKMRVAGAEREYSIHVPPSYNGQTPMPMVLLLHGHGQDGDEIARQTKMTEIADREGFIAIYPDARTWAGKEQWRAWDTDNGLLPPGSKADDVKFLRAIIEKGEKDFTVDPNRIYMAGMSNGGMMTFRAAGELSDKLAAIAIVSGAMSGREPPPSNQMSVMNIHGTEDVIVPYDGLKNVPSCLTAIGLPKFKSTSYTTDFWVEQNKITNPPIELTNGNVTEKRFINPDTGVEVNEYTITGGRHVPGNISKITDDIWHFFEAHPRKVAASSGTTQEGVVEFNVTERLKGHLAKRGIRGLEDDFASMLNESQSIQDGSISPSGILNRFEQKSGVVLTDGISDFFKSADSLSKSGSRITLDLNKKREINIGSRSGQVELKSVHVDDTSFDLGSINGRPTLSNISGVSLNLNALGSDYSVRVHEAAQKLDSAGNPYYRIMVDNPLPTLARRVMFSNDRIAVSMSLDSNAHPTVLNRREIKDATLGYNPVSRGFIDTYQHGANFAESPSWLGGLNVVKDVGIYGGSGYGGYKLAAMKFGRRGGVVGAVAATVIFAPSVIHGLERAFGE